MGDTVDQGGMHIPSQDSAARRLGALLTNFDSDRRVLDQRSSLGAADMRLLWLFSDGVSRTMRQVAEQLGLEQSTVNRQVNTAVEEGLLTKSRQGTREPYHFAVSAAGAREFENTLEATLEVYRQALEVLGEDGEKFLDLLERYIQAYRQAVHRM